MGCPTCERIWYTAVAYLSVVGPADLAVLGASTGSGRVGCGLWAARSASQGRLGQSTCASSSWLTWPRRCPTCHDACNRGHAKGCLPGCACGERSGRSNHSDHTTCQTPTRSALGSVAGPLLSSLRTDAVYPRYLGGGVGRQSVEVVRSLAITGGLVMGRAINQR